MKKNFIQKGLAVGIILLFTGIVFLPSINARNDMKVPKAISMPEKGDSITVFEYRPDGTIGKSVVKMSRIKMEKFKEELSSAKDINAWLSIYKKYDLIPQNITAEKLRAGMEEKAQRMGLTKERLEQLASGTIAFNNEKNKGLRSIFDMHSDILCAVVAVGIRGITVPLGISLVALFLNYYFYIKYHIGWLILSVDFSDRIISSEILVRTAEGQLSDLDIFLCGTAKLIGFVGVSTIFYAGQQRSVAFLGYTAYVHTVGLDLKQSETKK